MNNSNKYYHQENISVKSISPYTPLLYSETRVYRGIPDFLIFDPKYILCTHNICFELIKKNQNIFEEFFSFFFFFFFFFFSEKMKKKKAGFRNDTRHKCLMSDSKTHYNDQLKRFILHSYQNALIIWSSNKVNTSHHVSIFCISLSWNIYVR